MGASVKETDSMDSRSRSDYKEKGLDFNISKYPEMTLVTN